MARGGIEVYVKGDTTGLNPASRAEITAANRSIASGGDLLEAVGRVKNAGGGVIRVKAEQVGQLLANTPKGILQASDGSIVVLDRAFGGKKDAITIIDAKTGEARKATGGEFQVNSQGDITGARFGGSTFVVQRTNVDITKNMKDGLISVMMPPNLRGAAYDKSGNLNGWRINPKAIPDQAIRAAVYRLMGKDGVIRIPKESPVYAKLEARLSKAGYDRAKMGEIFQLFKETENFRYKAGDDARAKELNAAFGAGQRKANEAAG